MRMLEHPLLARHGAALALLAMFAWFAQSLASLLLDEPTRALDATMLVPLALTLGALGAVIATERRQGRLRRIATPLALGGLLLCLPGQLGMALDIGWLWRLCVPLGMAGWLGGMALLGIAILRDGVLPRRVGVALILAQPLAVIAGLAFSPISPLADHGDYSGAVGHAVVWLVVALALRERERVADRAPAVRAAPAAATSEGGR